MHTHTRARKSHKYIYISSSSSTSGGAVERSCGLYESTPCNSFACNLCCTFHFLGGRPLPRFPSTAPCSSCFSTPSDLLTMCPKYFSFLSMIPLLMVKSDPILSRTHTFVFLSFHDTCNILLSHHISKASTLFLSFFVMAQDSLPYIAIENEVAWSRRKFRLRERPRLFQMWDMLCTVDLAIASLLLISMVLSPLLLIIEPKYSNWFTTSILFPAMVKSVLLLSLSTTIIFVFLVFRRRSFSSLACLMRFNESISSSLLLQTRVVSSAYLGFVIFLPPNLKALSHRPGD